MKFNYRKERKYFLDNTMKQLKKCLVFFLKLRSSLTEVFCKKVLLEISQKFTGKHLCQSLFFNKVAGPFLAEHLRWLLLEVE